MGAAILCSRCGYDNPRLFPSCARCRAPLTRPGAGGTLSGADTFVDVPATTQRSAPPTPSDRPEGLEPGEELGLLGQEAAVRAAYANIERAFAIGAPSLVAFAGARGSGKSRLLFQAAHEATKLDPQARVLYAAARAKREGSYSPFARLLHEGFDLGAEGAPGAVLERLADELSLGASSPAAEPLAPGEDDARDPRALHAQARAALRAVFEATVARRPTLLLLDDMHLAEAPAWELLTELSRVDGPLAIVLAGGPDVGEAAGAIKAPSGVVRRAIAPLAEPDVRAMLLRLVPSLEEVPEALAGALTHRSKGNPRAIRELVFSLFEAGVLEREGERVRCHLGRLGEPDMPVTMEDAVRARLARLDPLERATVERAAVVGETFWEGAILGQMRTEQPPDERDPVALWQDESDAQALAEALARLEAKGFIESGDDGHPLGAREYRFSLPGTRRYLYASLDEATRAARHAIVARWLSVAAGRPRDELAGLTAPHLERAGQRIGAGRAYLRAALHARTHRHTSRALASVARALELLPADDAELRVEALHLHGALLGTVGQYHRALEAFSEMLSLAHRIDARGTGGAALNRIARVHRERGDEAKALAALDQALALFRAIGDQRGIAACQDDLAQIAMHRGELEAAAQAASEALAIRRAHRDRRGEALSLTTLGRLETRRGNAQTAETMLRAGLELRLAVDDHDGVRQSLGALGRLWLDRGDRAEAMRTWRLGLSRAREAGDRRSEALFLVNLGEALMLEGRLDAAEESLTRADELARELGDRRAAAEIARQQGRLASRRGAPDARTRLDEALRFAEAHGSRETIALTHRNIGQLEARTLYDPEGAKEGSAVDSFLTSIDLFRELGNDKEAARSLMDLGQHLLETGDAESAKERLGEARALLRKMGLPEARLIGQLLAEL